MLGCPAARAVAFANRVNHSPMFIVPDIDASGRAPLCPVSPAGGAKVRAVRAV